jgi:hypothetical protein
LKGEWAKAGESRREGKNANQGRCEITTNAFDEVSIETK